MHTEIFTFQRLSGKNHGREWSTMLRPIVKKWERFVAGKV